MESCYLLTSINEEHAVCSNRHFNPHLTHIRYKTKYVYNILIRNITNVFNFKDEINSQNLNALGLYIAAINSCLKSFQVSFYIQRGRSLHIFGIGVFHVIRKIYKVPSKHMTSKGRWVLVDFWSRRHITNIQRHSDVKMKRLINVGF